jgi:hypothetical protein
MTKPHFHAEPVELARGGVSLRNARSIKAALPGDYPPSHSLLERII